MIEWISDSMTKRMELLQDFYEDLFEELSKYGDIENLNICDNIADHMVSLLLSPVFLSLFYSKLYC